ncbi:unnamed protein product [Durusdinium trenchii]|uniref:Uncharacterized protein n=1 Tax=Durusdinium trenchii TaxID=1381693 RepID=A0ABP0NQG4_9DINO
MAQLHVYSAGYTTRDSENQKKANARHVLIPNFLAVAKAMKTTLPEGLVSPCGLFAVFEGEPLAAEHCAKNMHIQLLRHLSKVEGKVNETQLKRSLRGALVSLDVEVQEKLPGQRGCSAAAALLCGERLLVGVVGTASAASCQGPATLADAVRRPPVQLVARVKRNLGDAGAAAPKLGATGGQFLHAQLSGQVKGRDTAAQLGSEDVKVLQLSEQHHDCLILGSASLLRGTTLTELQAAVGSCDAGDALAVSSAVGAKAKSRQVQKTSDKACWVQSEREENEITCCAVLLHRGEALKEKASAQQVAKKQRVAADVKPTASLAEAAEKAAEKRWETRDRGETTAIGPSEHTGQAPELIKEEGKIFDILELDGTAQWRMKNYGTAHFRGGENFRSKEERSKGKGKKGKGKGKGKGRKGKRKKGEEDEEDEGDEGEYEEEDDGDITGDEKGPETCQIWGHTWMPFTPTDCHTWTVSHPTKPLQPEPQIFWGVPIYLWLRPPL